MKLKVLRILFGILLALYPLFSTVSVAYADISMPSMPNMPSMPSQPDQPGEQAGTLSTDSSAADTTTQDTTTLDASNSNTGSGSTNTAQNTLDNDTEATLDNEADINNYVSGDADTGYNESDNNTGNGSVTTGKAGLTGYLKTSANNVVLESLECTTECEAVSLDSLEANASNSETGASSTNNASNYLDNTDNLAINNDAYFNNYVDFDANSGYNSTSENTGDGTIVTGDAEIILTALNIANTIGVDYAVFNVFDDQTGDIIIDYGAFQPLYLGGSETNSTNNTTGSSSTNNASNTLNNSNTILIDNDGNIINNYYLDANTGNNTADKNTGNGSITTGDANIVFNLINFFNNVFLGGGELLLGIVNIFGTLDGDIVLRGLDSPSINSSSSPSLSSSNNTTGSNSTNTASNSLDNDTTINMDNTAMILNNVNLDASTGNNSASDNTGSGSITTGDVNANLKVTNIANTNVLGDGGTIWMVLINNLGHWTGQLFGGDPNTGTYSPYFTFTINPDGSIAANEQTGSGSNNTATNDINNNTEISLSNNATLQNNIMINANTGGNSASKNTGSGTIKTGDVKVAANIVNILNNNFVGSRFILSIVNIFGKFLGDIRKDSVGTATIEISQNESIAIGPTNVSVSPNTPQKNKTLDTVTSNLSSVSSDSSENQESMFLGSNDKDGGSPVNYFAADPSLFDGFKLWYLIIPMIIGTLLVIIRRATSQ